MRFISLGNTRRYKDTRILIMKLVTVRQSSISGGCYIVDHTVEKAGFLY